jgi:hypothetical protein
MNNFTGDIQFSQNEKELIGEGSMSFIESLSEDFFLQFRTENRWYCYRIETQIARGIY